MKRVLALLLFSLPPLAGAGGFVDLRDAPVVAGDAAAGAAKVAVCVACHGAEGNAAVTAFPALAAQHPGYLYQSLAGFRRRADPASPMTPQVQSLGDADLRDIAVYFASRRRSAPAVSSAADLPGARLFRDGDAARGIVPCQGCHGATAQGHPLHGTAPRYDYYPALAAQSADYLAARLRRYRDDGQVDTSNALIMRGIARNLDDAAIAELAAWLAATPRESTSTSGDYP
ncbi:c-type cytochrome [Tahibacter caeni]|uniref:c-type cytochrome n=1 Tax=Tahibacter caeni TaxID=1453545 RepID=UPI0021471FC3|nr:c-type cytochrome [Tahibacter caeni]